MNGTLFEFLTNSVIVPIVFIFGMTGNFFALKVLSNKKLKDIGPIQVYKFLLITDTIYLPQIIITYLATGFNFDPTILSSLSCKFYQYFNFAFGAFSPWLLVYISVEKLMSISYKSKQLRQFKNEIKYIIAIVVFAFVYYIPQAFCWDVINTSETINQTTLECSEINYKFQLIASLMDTIHAFLLPFLLMIIFSTLLIVSIFKSRSRVFASFNENRNIKRDIIFAISSFSMNLLFIILNLPIIIIEFIPEYSLVDYNFANNFFYLSYGINFYVLLITNSIFRKEFKNLLICPKT